ncbi:MAG TPA: aminotransferase class V-fold PLP-dependent enzyme [Anaerolineae bacterium]|nr:aminotransferase class V-fold PLP-dependent enzyme [Anaerolineae bacterium]HIQ06516.1 aminotransferase class V-fold PLP-dependent enzyme [Anaerolineae bacterium]
MTDAQIVDRIRAELPAVQRYVYLNTGTAGPLSHRTADALAALASAELTQGRIHPDNYEPIMATINELREHLARLMGADVDEIALTHHTTDGMNIATWGLNWRPGDELLTTNLEHEGGLLPLYMVRQRFGVTIRFANLGLGGGDVAARIEQAITPRTRLLSISHVSFRTGALLPLDEIVDVAHRHGVLVVVDGAQSAGAIPVDMHALGVDFYAIPGQKWLCGPEGTGALYVRRDRISELNPTFVGYFSTEGSPPMDMTGYFMPAPGARRYEVSTMYYPGLAGWLESLRWLEELGSEWIYGRIQVITGRWRAMLDSIPGAGLLTPASYAGLTSFTVEGLDPEQATQALVEQGILIRYVDQPYCLRVSTGFYNNENDLVCLRDALERLV